MKNITLSTGGETYCFNGDESRSVTINFTDPNLPARFEKCYSEIEKRIKAAREGSVTAEKLLQLDKEAKDLLDTAFNAPVSAAAFGNMSIFTPVGESVLFKEFADKFIPEIEAQVEKLGSQLRARKVTLDMKKLDKYTAPYSHTLTGNSLNAPTSVTGLTEEQKQYCRQLMEEMMRS